MKEKNKGLEIHHLLVVSTAHLTIEGSVKLDSATAEKRHAGRGVFVDKYEYGYHLALADDDPGEEWIDDGVRDIVRFARANGCTHVRIDTDGPVVPLLPTYQYANE